MKFWIYASAFVAGLALGSALVSRRQSAPSRLAKPTIDGAPVRANPSLFAAPLSHALH